MHVISQSGADALLSQLNHGLLTPDEYHRAIALVEPLREAGERCIYCSASAVLGQTCAIHTDLQSVMNAGKAARPIVDISRCSTPAQLITAVMTALERSGRELPAGRFAERAERAQGMNALCQIAINYVKLRNLL